MIPFQMHSLRCITSTCGVMAYLRSYIAGDRLCDMEFKDIESISVEVNLNGSKCIICGAYKPPSLSDTTFQDDFNMTIDKILSKTDNCMVIGDLNFDMLQAEKCQPIFNSCDIFDLTNILKNPTCFTKNGKPTLLDLILTKSSSFISGT